MEKEERSIVLLNEIMDDPDKIFNDELKMKEVIKDPVAVVELLKHKDSYHETVEIEGRTIELFRPTSPSSLDDAKGYSTI